MAKALLVCIECGKSLSADDKFCSQCGAHVREDVHEAKSELQHVRVNCEVCGHENLHGGAYCEACGVKLPEIAGRSAGHPLKPQKANLPTQGRPPQVQKSSFKFETWQYVTMFLVVGLVAVFVYIELQRDHTGTQTHQTQVPATQSPSAPPSKEILETIDRLQKTVNENPYDIGSKLLLANALHDAALHDGSLFARAIEAYKVYLNEKPGDPNARVDLGICYFELGKVDSIHAGRLFSMAISEMEAAVKSAPTHQAGAFNLGIVNLYAGNLRESNKWLQKAVDLNAESDLGKRAKAILEQHNQAG